MPPKTRGSKTLKASKENVGVANKTKLKIAGNSFPRKALADKTNSTSDDNVILSPTKHDKLSSNKELKYEPRQKRERRIPMRYKGNPVLVNLSNSNNEVENSTPVKSQVKKTLSIKKGTLQVSSIKTSSKALGSSILKSRPKRICRLPSKLEGHSISPNKYIPLQPIGSSTPIANKSIKVTKTKVSKPELVKTPAKNNGKRPILKKVKNKVYIASDSNNNGKKQQLIDKCFEKQIAKSKKITCDQSSFRVFDDVKKSLKRNSSKVDPYEFTFDPDEEPPPQKKIKKRTLKKNPSKPKAIVKGIYEKNLAKALATLRNNVAKKTPTSEMQPLPISNPPSDPVHDSNIQSTGNYNLIEIAHRNEMQSDAEKSLPCANNYNSIRIEDIALDLQEPNDGHTINYSPVNSPCSNIPPTDELREDIPVNKNDPLNLQNDLSFFDDQPIASSSINMSVRHPLASPWRVEFGSLPIKWQVNTYVKPNMTPAVESSFTNFGEVQKKHVYTNIVPESNNTLSQVADTSLKQTSIYSFIKEVSEKSAKKKTKSTPVKANSLFEDVTHPSLILSPTKSVSSKKNSKDSFNSNNSNVENVDVINEEDLQNSRSNTPHKKHEGSKQGTFFGFEESEDENQENISPNKKDKKKALKSRSRAVLQEINTLKGPFRAAIPISAKFKPILNSDILNRDFEDPKSALEPPVFLNKETPQANAEITDLNCMDDDSQSVHLFEDIDLIHHYHQPRKSYAKTKKVTFRHNSVSDSDTPAIDNEEQDSSDDDNLDDLSFKLPTAKPKRTAKKKLTKKQKITKKEEQEVETWAAGFNSMCEDIEEFDLIVE